MFEHGQSQMLCIWGLLSRDQQLLEDCGLIVCSLLQILIPDMDSQSDQEDLFLLECHSLKIK